MTTDAPHDLTMTGHARETARAAREVASRVSILDLGFDRELAALIAELADIVAELAATHDRIHREDDLR